MLPSGNVLLTAGLFLLFVSSSTAEPPKTQSTKRTDLYGDPLPAGAIARLGSGRFRQYCWASFTGMAFSPDGKTLFSGNSTEPIRLWDVATGRELRRFTGLDDANSNDYFYLTL